MPAEDSAERQPRYGQRRPVHPALVGAGHLEGGEVLAHFPQAIDLGIGIARPIGVAVDEVAHPQIVSQPYAPGVGDVAPIDAAGMDVEAVEGKQPERRSRPIATR